MIRLIFIITAILIPAISYCQKATVSGVISGANSELLVGVNIFDTDLKYATISDINGFYSLSLEAGVYEIHFQFIGKEKVIKNIRLKEGEYLQQDIFMETAYEMIDAVVVSASRFERRQAEETVSIEVMQGDLIERQNPIRLEESLNKIPGVVVMDGQTQIRGGSGWSYGSGSRVQVLLDGIPILSSDAADSKWDLIPPDIIQQVEVIKGASSALYGSAAMNGIINVTSVSPSIKPKTKIRLFGSVYGNPEQDEMKWWDNAKFDVYPKDFGVSITHLRKIKRIDLSGGLYYNSSDSYLQTKYNDQIRVFSKFRYRFKEKLNGLQMGVNLLASTRKNRTFILWNGVDSLGYIPLPNSTPEGRNTRIALDPFISYIDKKQNKVTFKGRYFNSANKITSDSNQASNPSFYYSELQYQRRFEKLNLVLTSGVNGNWSRVRSFFDNSELSLAGEHDASNVALYGQIEKSFFNKLNIAAGIRWEYFKVDSMPAESAPNFRVGINYQPTSTTFIRSSYGQAYRFPSIVEKFASTNLGGIGIFSNPKLKSETGWSAELGLKQLFKIGNWKGYTDIAGFYNRYENMIEFSFGQFASVVAPPFLGLGFSAQNVGDTEIKGVEISNAIQGKFGKHDVSAIVGYYYIVPKSLNWDDTLVTYSEAGTEIKSLTYAQTTSSDENFLPYRFSHSFKADIEAVLFDKIRLGVNMQYRSYLKSISQAFVSDLFVILEPSFNSQAFSGIREWRERTNNKGEVVLDGRIAYLINDNMDISLLIKNLTNNTYVNRPAILEPPRNFTIKYSYDF